MRRLMRVALVLLLLSLGVVAMAAASSDPVGGCPGNFELHPAMSHDDDHGHHHVGTDTDRNGDGWICVQHVSVDDNVHVHIDNNLPLP